MVGYTSLAVFLFSSIALIIPSGFSAGATLLLLGSAVLLRQPAAHPLDRADRTLIAALALYFFVHLANNLAHAAHLREYDPPLRFLLAIPPLLLLLARPARPGALWAGLAVGAIGAGVLAGWEHFAEGELRAAGSTNPIQYGNISLLQGVLCLPAMAWARAQPRARLWTAFLGAGALFGVAGALFSGSRGSWIALPFCLAALVVHHALARGKRALSAGLLALTALIGAVYALPQTNVAARTDMAIREAEDYVRNGNADSSVGARLEMWSSGIAMIPGHLWLGWGKEGYVAHKLALIHQGKIAPNIDEHTHLHNEYLDALVKHGIPGLLALLILFVVPLALFARHLKDGEPLVRPYAIAGVMVCISYMVFGLTQAFLTHNNGVMMFAFLQIFLWSSLRAAQRTAAQGPQAPPFSRSSAAQLGPA